jgi:N-acetylmuramoyl-L-alanine amidase
MGVVARMLGRGVCLTFVLGLVLPAAGAGAAQPLRITLDPGHGGAEIGASYHFAEGVVLQEKTLSLRVALRVRHLLEQAGFGVTLTRSTDAPVNISGQELNGDGRLSLADELQARVDAANRAGSDVLVSIHFNGSSDPTISGTETFWNPHRAFSDRSRQLAERIQRALLTDLAAAGYATRDRGIETDASLLNGESFFLLGPRSNIIRRPSQMPAIISEPLFLTNASDASAMRDDRAIEAVARGYFDGIRAYAASTNAAAPAEAPAAAAQKPSSTGAPRRWTVWAITYTDSPQGRRLAGQAARSLTAIGIPSAVLTTGQTSSLRPGFVVVTSAPLDTRQAASARVAQLRQAGYPGAYVRTVPTDHSL